MIAVAAARQELVPHNRQVAARAVETGNSALFCAALSYIRLQDVESLADDISVPVQFRELAEGRLYETGSLRILARRAEDHRWSTNKSRERLWRAIEEKSQSADDSASMTWWFGFTASVIGAASGYLTIASNLLNDKPDFKAVVPIELMVCVVGLVSMYAGVWSSKATRALRGSVRKKMYRRFVGLESGTAPSEAVALVGEQ